MTFHLSFLWIFFFVLSCFSNAMKTYTILTIMMLIHEIGHIMMARFLKYQIKDIKIYPFGLCAQILESNHGKSWHELLIIISGIGIHLFYPVLFYVAYRLDFISLAYLNTLNEINHNILIFNLLPIYPLDGGKICNAIINIFFSYPHSLTISLILSAITFIYILLQARINMILVLCFISFQYIQIILHRQQDLLLFYYYRYQHPLNKKTNQVRKTLYRNKSVQLYKRNQRIEDEKWLKTLFEYKK